MGTAFKILPKNYLADWGEFESWASGAASAPDGWISASSPFGLAQETTNIKFGVSSARIIGSTGGVAGIYRTIPDGVNYQGRTFKLGLWGKSSSTGPYFELNDGVSSKTIHLDGTNAFVFLTTPPMKIDYAATQLRINLFASTTSTAYFDGAVLVEGEDMFTTFDNNITISDWQPTLNLKQDQFEIAGREGSFVPDTHLQARNLKLTGSVVGTDVVSCRTNFDTLMRSLLAWQTTEKRHLYLYDDRVTDVFLKGVDWKYEKGMNMIRFNSNLVSPDSTTKSIGKYRKRQVISGTITEFNLSYGGSALSKPIISFIADQAATISTCIFENLTTGDNFAFTGVVSTNSALDIDCDEGTVLNSSVDSLGSWSGDFVGLVRGTNYLRFTGNNCTINIDWFERYL